MGKRSPDEAKIRNDVKPGDEHFIHKHANKHRRITKTRLTRLRFKTEKLASEIRSCKDAKMRNVLQGQLDDAISSEDDAKFDQWVYDEGGVPDKVFNIAMAEAKWFFGDN